MQPSDKIVSNAEEKENEGVYIITVPQSQAKQAEKLMRGFMMALQEEQDKTEDTAGDKNKDAETRTYTKKAGDRLYTGAASLFQAFIMGLFSEIIN